MDKSVMDPSYNPETVEDRQYRLWLEKDSLLPGERARGAVYHRYSAPNVTGSLHMGHALNCTIQDIIIRWRRMQGMIPFGFLVLIMPVSLPRSGGGGLGKGGMTRHELGREPFLEKVWEWKETYHARITEQLQRLGSLATGPERFTMDERLFPGGAQGIC